MREFDGSPSRQACSSSASSLTCARRHPARWHRAPGPSTGRRAQACSPGRAAAARSPRTSPHTRPRSPASCTSPVRTTEGLTRCSKRRRAHNAHTRLSRAVVPVHLSPQLSAVTVRYRSTSRDSTRRCSFTRNEGVRVPIRASALSTSRPFRLRQVRTCRGRHQQRSVYVAVFSRACSSPRQRDSSHCQYTMLSSRGLTTAFAAQTVHTAAHETTYAASAVPVGSANTHRDIVDRFRRSTMSSSSPRNALTYDQRLSRIRRRSTTGQTGSSRSDWTSQCTSTETPLPRVAAGLDSVANFWPFLYGECASGISDDGGAGGHVAGHDGAGADRRRLADPNTAENHDS